MPQGIVQLEWCATYSGPVREAIHAFKYRGERRLAHPLASALARRWHAAGRSAELVTWVPVHPSRRRERGFDQAEELARHMARTLSLPVAPLVARSQRTAAQHALGQAQRASNTAGAFVAADDARTLLGGRWVLLVDDILTTGATIAGCATALLEAGALAVSAIALARDR